MDSFLIGLLSGVGVIVAFAAILLPIVLTMFSAWWLLLYLVEIPLGMGFIGMALKW